MPRKPPGPRPFGAGCRQPASNETRASPPPGEPRRHPGRGVPVPSARRPRAVPYASHSTIPKKVTVLRPLTYFRDVPLTVLYTSTPLPSSEGSA